jgi:hypothetical protein
MKIKNFRRDELVEAVNREANKKIGIILHDTGFLRYSKLTPENYLYWWYEVKNLSELNKKTITYKWEDMFPTWKTNYLQKIAPMYKKNTDGYKIINDVLILICYLEDGEKELANEYLKSLNN